MTPAGTALAAVVLAAGRGERLRPLTDRVPKPLLDVGGTTLLDAALDRVAAAVPQSPETTAVNAHWLAEQIVDAVGGRAHVSVETPVALGTAGAIGALRGWLAGRDVLIANSDVWFAGPVDVRRFVAGWDRERPRLLVVEDRQQPDFEQRWRFAGLSLLPGAVAATLEPTPSGLYEVVWRHTALDLCPVEVEAIDCGTPDGLARARAVAGSFTESEH